MRFALRTLLAAVSATLGAVALLGTSGHGGSAQSGFASTADETPGYAVENFAYPNADQILQQKGITLKRGDGHIVLADCDSAPGLLEVWARSQDRICFQVTGATGFLTMEIPSVYGIKGNDYDTTVDMTVDGEDHSFAVGKNEWTPVGETTDPGQRPFMLLEISTQA